MKIPYKHREVDVAADTQLMNHTVIRMNAKLHKARDKGRGGWFEPDCDITYLYDLLIGHVTKGNADMVDVVNIAAMIDYRMENNFGERGTLIKYIAEHYTRPE